jgi:hypothetical protein
MRALCVYALCHVVHRPPPALRAARGGCVVGPCLLWGVQVVSSIPRLRRGATHYLSRGEHVTVTRIRLVVS